MKKEEKRINYLSIYNLYTTNIFQRSTILVLLLSIIIISIGVYFSTNPNYSLIDYLKNETSFYTLYFRQSLFIVGIFNSIIISTITIRLIHQSKKFDYLFISFVGRKKIAVIKILSSMLILFLLLLFECILIVFIGLFKYKNFKFEINGFLSFLNLYILMIFELVITFLASEIINNIFTPMIVLFMCILYKILTNNYEFINNYTKYIIPSVSFDVNNMMLIMNNPLIIIIWILSIILIYIEVYSFKDL